jgi:hypothetical protein
LGSEDGRAGRGGAVIHVHRLVHQSHWVPCLVCFLTLSFLLEACSRQSQSTPDSATPANPFLRIPKADLTKYEAGPREHKNWGNPYLVIRPSEVALLIALRSNEEEILKPEEVLNGLSRLPASAWPYGRLVAIFVDEKPSLSEQERIALRRNRGIVAGELQTADVAIAWVPGSE